MGGTGWFGTDSPGLSAWVFAALSPVFSADSLPAPRRSRIVKPFSSSIGSPYVALYTTPTRSVAIAFSADVLEKPAGKHRQPELDAENDEQDAGEAPPDPHCDELARVGQDRLIQDDWRRDTDQLLTEGHVLEDRLLGESSETFEQLSSHEQSLVPVNNPRAPAPEVVEERH